MAFSMLGARFYYHTLDLSDYVEQVDPELSRDLAAVKPLSAGGARHYKGHRAITIALAGIYDGADDAIGEQAWAAFDGEVARPWAYIPQAYSAVGSVAYFGTSNLGSERITAGEGVVKFPVSVMGSDDFYRGRIQLPMLERTGSSDGASSDDTSASTDGAAAVLIAPAVGAGNTLAVRLLHSINNSDWDDLVVFTPLTAAGSQLLVVTGAVRRYIMAEVVQDEGEKATFFVGFARL
jgi:hypothetical protein